MKKILPLLTTLAMLAVMFHCKHWVDVFHMTAVIPAVIALVMLWIAIRKRSQVGAPPTPDRPLAATAALAVIKAAMLTAVAISAGWCAEQTPLYDRYVDRDLADLRTRWTAMEETGHLVTVADQIQARLDQPVSDHAVQMLAKRLIRDLTDAGRTTATMETRLAVLDRAIDIATTRRIDASLAEALRAGLIKRQQFHQRVKQLEQSGQHQKLLDVVAEAARTCPEIQNACVAECVAACVALSSDATRSLAERTAIAAKGRHLAVTASQNPTAVDAILAPLEREMTRRREWAAVRADLTRANDHDALTTMVRDELVRVESDPHRIREVAAMLFDILVAHAEHLVGANETNEQMRVLAQAITHAQKYNLDPKIAHAKLDSLAGKIDAGAIMADLRSQILGARKTAADADIKCEAAQDALLVAEAARKTAEVNLATLRRTSMPAELPSDTTAKLLRVHRPQSMAPFLIADVAVSNAAGEPVANLASQDFRVWTDSNRPATVASVFRSGQVVDRKLQIALVIDRSGSIRSELPAVKRAYRDLLTHMGPTQRFSLFSFSDAVERLVAGNGQDAVSAIDAITASGATALWDAIHTAATDLAQDANSSSERFLVILTDGADSGYGRSMAQAIQTCRQANVRVMTLGLGTKINAAALEQVAAATGGMHVAAAKADDLLDAMRQISRTVLAPTYRIALACPADPTTPWRLVIGTGTHAQTVTIEAAKAVVANIPRR